MYVPFLLFVIVIVLILIFWELSKIHSRIKRMLAQTHAIITDNKEVQR